MADSPLHFTGNERDSESGLDYFRARYYGVRLPTAKLFRRNWPRTLAPTPPSAPPERPPESVHPSHRRKCMTGAGQRVQSVEELLVRDAAAAPRRRPSGSVTLTASPIALRRSRCGRQFWRFEARLQVSLPAHKNRRGAAHFVAAGYAWAFSRHRIGRSTMDWFATRGADANHARHTFIRVFVRIKPFSDVRGPHPRSFSARG